MTFLLDLVNLVGLVDQGKGFFLSERLTLLANFNRFWFMCPLGTVIFEFYHLDILKRRCSVRSLLASGLKHFDSLRQDPLDLSFWSFFTFLHHGIKEVERHLL